MLLVLRLSNSSISVISKHVCFWHKADIERLATNVSVVRTFGTDVVVI